MTATYRWETQSTRDTGNGALIHVSRSPDFPGVKMFEFVSYCGREENKTWFERDGDAARTEYDTAEDACDTD